ncbi:DUF2779 domain-containing protein [Candidatus Woesearchaeota archaeon]|nr:DUF2779 domain-containing protein [Candidatus Woesearchaeota archaeon]
MPLLTKSKYLNGLQCPKLLWTVINDKGSMPPVDAATQHLFDQGHTVGDQAKAWFPEGIQVPIDFKENIVQTRQLVLKRKPLFEPGFLINNLYARADIITPVEDDKWDIIEVKSSTQVKDINIQDVAFQKHVYEKFGLKIRNCYLMFINNEYVRQGDIDSKQLLKMQEITDEVNAIANIQENIDKMFEIISKNRPTVKIGPQCSAPYACALNDKCWAFLPEHNVFNLYYAGKKAFELFQSGITDIKDIPNDYNLNPKQLIQKNAVTTGQTHIDKEAIKSFVQGLEYPIYYLDFETINPAVPLFDNTRPYQQIPFQFSLHIEQEDNSIEHHEFLHNNNTDPRPAFITALKNVLGNSGTIIAFNQSFEISRLRELSETFPEYKEWYNHLLPRFIDLIVPFRNFDYHNPKQKGSNSLKAVLPAVTEKGYDNLEINNGGDASLAYLDMICGDMTPEKKEKTRKNLLKYCCLDTEGMVWIVGELRKLV